MSTITSDRAQRRKADQVRRHALEVGRRLLTSGGPGALTLKAIGAAMGMSHANLIHHFGSADSFQAELRGFMVDELTRAVTRRVEEGDPADAAALVDMVFDAYAEGGIGTLLAWSALTQARSGPSSPLQAVHELVAALETRIEGSDKTQRARAITCLVTSLALSQSLIGRELAEIAGGDQRFMRDLALQVLLRLRDEPRR